MCGGAYNCFEETLLDLDMGHVIVCVVPPFFFIDCAVGKARRRPVA